MNMWGIRSVLIFENGDRTFPVWVRDRIGKVLLFDSEPEAQVELQRRNGQLSKFCHAGSFEFRTESYGEL
jgi:hypothetical protein